MSIRGKLLATYLVLTGLGMSLLAGYVLWSFRAYIIRTVQVDLASTTTAVSESVADALERGDDRRVHTLVQRYAHQDRINIRVFRPEGTLLATSAPRQDRNRTDWPELSWMREAREGRATGGVEDVPGSPVDELYEVRPMRRGGRTLGVLRMSRRMVFLHQQFQSVVRIVLGALAAAFALCTLLSALVARSIALPIQTMRTFAARMGEGYFGEKLDVRRRDELGQLAASLNGMSERLASLDDERRAFLANASHELRTPVSNVHVTLEALESGADEEPDVRARFIRTALDETGRLSRLVQNLLELGRLEAGVVPLDRRPVRLEHVVTRCAHALETRMRSGGLRLEVDIVPAVVRVDEERLVQALLNVLENAIRHSPAGAAITLTGRRDEAWAEVAVRDRGPGIAEADLPHVFEQFYTADPARQRGGTGLGLAISRRILEAHGGSIGVRGTSGQGAEFLIRLPLDQEAPTPAGAAR